jgi:starch-binding outer membrane protein, SusD/RagB family
MKSIISLFFLVVILFTASCKKGFLDKIPDGDLTLDQIFQDPAHTRGYLNNVYAHMPKEGAMVDPPAPNPYNGISDDMEMSYEASQSNNWNAGNWNSSSEGAGLWTDLYTGIRKANVFLENVNKLVPSEFASQERISQWKAEATFLRAFYHFLLMRVYGPVPIMDKTVGLDEDYLKFRRQPIDKCVDFVVAECDKAAVGLLPRVVDPADQGRPSKATALALKARALLYMASPLWNGNSTYASFTSDGVRLFPDADANRWQTAATAAKACIDQALTAGYKLYNNNPDPSLNYQELFWKNFNEEVLFAIIGGGMDDGYAEPRGFVDADFGLISPTQNLVDAYETKEGVRPILGYNADNTPILNPEATTYSDNTQAATATSNYVTGTRGMYVNRDPRFYASIIFTGQKYKWTRTTNPRSTPIQFWRGGYDGRLANGHYAETGYLLKKIGHPDFSRTPRIVPQRSWIFFRLGEQYLNYAEALNEAQGPVGDVYTYVNLIRTRAGMPNLPAGLSKDQMRERIRHERRIELAFETHRFFDTRRWKIAEVTDNAIIYGLDVQATGYNMSSDAFYKRTPIEKRVFDPGKHYLWPIPQVEINKNPKLIQNPGW